MTIPTTSRRLPASVTILSVFVLCITFWYAIRIYGAIANWQVLIEFGASPVYILATGILWALTGVAILVFFIRGSRFSLLAASLAAAAWFFWYWLDRLVIQPSPAPNTLFSVVVSTLSLAAFLVILFLPASKSFFNEE